MPDEWNLPALRPGREPDEALIAHRAEMESAIRKDPDRFAERASVPRAEVRKNGVLCYEVGDPDAHATVIYLHGGGFSLGHPEMWIRYAARIAEDAKVRLVLPRYRLAPEDPFPAGLRDVVSTYRAVRAERGARPVLVMGESAGASLTASLLVAASRIRATMPDGAIIISPVVDFSITADTYDSHAAVDSWVSRESIATIRDNYLQGHSPDDSLASPLQADVSAFPPVQLLCGGREVLLADTLALAGKLARANRSVEVQIIPDAEHGWTFVLPDTEAAERAMGHILRFIGSFASRAT